MLHYEITKRYIIVIKYGGQKMQNIIIKNKELEEKQNTFITQDKNIWKSIIEELTDPSSGMSEDEVKKYEAKIMAKLKSGKKLTDKEMEFLRIHSPELYRSALRVKHSKEQLEQQLKNCHSKEEVARLPIMNVSSKDPDSEYIVAGLNETMRQFKKSSAYARLPQKTNTEQKKSSRGKAASFEEKAEEEETNLAISPIQEVLDELPTFNVVQ